MTSTEAGEPLPEPSPEALAVQALDTYVEERFTDYPTPEGYGLKPLFLPEGAQVDQHVKPAERWGELLQMTLPDGTVRYRYSSIWYAVGSDRGSVHYDWQPGGDTVEEYIYSETKGSMEPAKTLKLHEMRTLQNNIERAFPVPAAEEPRRTGSRARALGRRMLGRSSDS